jgi:membrane-associated phospholipid phosphatase
VTAELPRSGRPVAALIVAAAALAVAHWLDPWAVAALRWPAANDRDWGRLLRVMGFAPTWGLVAAALWLEARRLGPDAAAANREVSKAILIAVVVGGLAAELIKLVIRRERPGDAAGYVFRSFSVEPFSTKGLGFPSSHAMVAFAGAAAVRHRFPRAALVLFGLAAGCGLTRLFASAHFLSDAVGAAIGGTWIGSALGRRFAGRRAPVGSE